MFVRAIEGRVAAKPMLHNGWDHLNLILSEGDSWLWSTGGIHDSEFIGLLAFVDRQRADSRLAQPAIRGWVDQITVHLEDPSITDCIDSRVLLPGSIGEAGFVQMISGSTSDKSQLTAVLEGMQEVTRSHRPDIIAADLAWLTPRRFIQTVYFTSEYEARSAEGKEFPGGLKGMLAELMHLMRDPVYLDIRDPWIATRDAHTPTRRAQQGGA